MSRVIPVGLVALMLVATAPHAPVAARVGTPGPRLTLAILPCTNIETTFRKFHPLLAYLQAATGIAIRLAVPANLTELEVATRNGQIDFALQDPHTYRQLSHLFDESSLLQTRALDGTTSQSGVVVVRRDSGIAQLTQVRGKTVMFGPRTSTPKWVAATLLFEANDLAVERDLKIVNGGCCEDIAFAVAVKTVDAGVICDHFLGLHAARQKEIGVEPGSLLVIGRTPAFPTRIFAARDGLPAMVVRPVTEALASLDRSVPDHASLLASAEIGGFVKTSKAEYLRALGQPTSLESR